MAIEGYFDELFDGRIPVSASKLLNLSSLSDTEAASFRGYWEQATVERRKGLMESLATIAEDNAEADFNAVFRVGLDDAVPEIRVKGIDGLWECRERWFLTKLLSMTECDAAEFVRAAATGALGKFVFLGVLDELRPPLMEKIEATLKRIIANQEESILVRRRAIEALSPSSDPGVNDIIRAAYYSEELPLKIGAVYAMGQHCDDGWLPVLLTELRSPQPELRLEAARACGELEDERAVPGLVELTKEQDSQVQEAAIEALGHIGGEEAKRALSRCLGFSDPRVREAARVALDELTFGEDPLAFH